MNIFSDADIIKPIWRIFSGILAALSLAVVAIRLYVAARSGLPEGTDEILFAMKLLFPLSVGLIFGYAAFTGQIPGMKRADKK